MDQEKILWHDQCARNICEQNHDNIWHIQRPVLAYLLHKQVLRPLRPSSVKQQAFFCRL
jgi:hypothetical protein